MPATRTPEGEPFSCTICGHQGTILVADEGDTVCPACGMHAWVPPRQKPAPRESVRPYAQLFDLPKRKPVKKPTSEQLEALVRVAQCSPEIEVFGEFLVQLLAEVLPAMGASVWVERESGWWLPKKNCALVATVGVCHTSKFARRILKEEQPLQLSLTIGREDVICLGVPIRGTEKVFAAVEAIVPWTVEASGTTADLEVVERCVRAIEDSRGVLDSPLGKRDMVTLPMSAARGTLPDR